MDNEKIITQQIISFWATDVVKDEKTYFVLYNSNMVPIKEVFRFINIFMNNESVNSRSIALYALKFLFCYQAMIGKNLQDFNLQDLKMLQAFLRGQNRVGNSIGFENLTYRSAGTVNGYLGIYRKYLDYLKQENPWLSARNLTKFTSFSENDYEKKGKYKLNEKTKAEEVPMYISVDEYRKIIKIVREEYTNREEIIIRLMYESGMRLGEVLGLTNEDIVIEKIDDEYQAVVYIRNRIKNNRHQKAKTCMDVISKRTYKTKDYNTVNCGYQIVYISVELYDLIGEYIEDEHPTQREKNSINYFENTITDSVCGNEENFYIFLNSLGKPLSYNSWRNIIKDIFIKCGISVDTQSKKHNLNHRFRHGFAMFQAKNLNLSVKETAILMRHSSISSTYKYYRPTTTDAINIKTKFAKELYKEIPELKKGEE